MLSVRHFVQITLVFLALTSSLGAQIVLKEAHEAPVPIAIQPFLKSEEDKNLETKATDMEATLTADLIFSRLFKVIPAEAFLESKITGPLESIQVDSWRQVGAQYVVRGRVFSDGGQTALEGFVFNIVTGKLDIRKTYKTGRSDHSILSHQFGDDIVELVTGKKGLFSTKIAFAYNPPNSRYKDIWVIDFNGRDARPLVHNNRTNLSPEWTMDGRFIYFSSSSTIHWHIWKTDLSGRSAQVTNFKGSALGPTMLPNGREFAASLSKDGNPDLYLLDMNGQVKRRLTKARGINIGPYASPDGKKLCFSSDRLGNLHIFSLDLQTEEAIRLTRLGTLNDSCAWNPFTDTILFSGMDTDREFDIFSMNEKGEAMERLTYDAKNNESPSWSPDGKLIVFSSRRSGRNQLYVMKADGTQIAPLAELPGDASQPVWSPRLGY